MLNDKYLSSGAKEVLIKSVAQALPTYVMGVFNYLQGIVNISCR
uniref:Uncharacterized protein n=1 Tax=Arundo donax TaxID=35708 RepID=A0A0A9A7U5_ARUDO